MFRRSCLNLALHIASQPVLIGPCSLGTRLISSRKETTYLSRCTLPSRLWPQKVRALVLDNSPKAKLGHLPGFEAYMGVCLKVGKPAVSAVCHLFGCLQITPKGGYLGIDTPRAAWRPRGRPGRTALSGGARKSWRRRRGVSVARRAGQWQDNFTVLGKLFCFLGFCSCLVGAAKKQVLFTIPRVVKTSSWETKAINALGLATLGRLRVFFFGNVCFI